ncbi:MAG: cobalt-precorrin-5B (C(1))-methyltransferase [Chloroflexi bacterium]|nr:cobalt-precorrin-5B (C(1))-methyltransferase [Chloroflexota bacterium]
MDNRAVQRHVAAEWRKPDLREGFTTGACAAAAAKAAARALLTGESLAEITVDLPARQGVTFHLARCEIGSSSVLCGVIKDAGDDPDVTHGAEIQALVAWQDARGITLAGGEGVGTVTKPGLAGEVGEPAINPVPRRMITAAVNDEADEAGVNLNRRGMLVTINVPGGAEIAQQTLNPRLGIVGGISIIGTTGIVKPFSDSAYRGSIYVELKVAAENGVRQAVLTTGSRSEAYAQARYPNLPEMAFVQVGDHMDYALRQCRRLKFPQVMIAGMIGKISKLAEGRMQTHVSRGGVNMAFLADLAGQLGADAALVARLQTANTARHVQTMLNKAGIAGLEAQLAQLAARHTHTYIQGALVIEVLLYDIRGDLLAAAQEPAE